MQRRLATILVADVVGYSRLMEAAEETTAARLQTCHQLMSEAVAAGDGRVFNRAGDAMLAEFASPINALRCAVQIRESTAVEDAESKARWQLRFGLHLADVMVAGDDLIGDGVNLAARIQQAAEPEAIYVSQQRILLGQDCGLRRGRPALDHSDDKDHSMAPSADSGRRLPPGRTGHR